MKIINMWSGDEVEEGCLANYIEELEEEIGRLMTAISIQAFENINISAVMKKS